MAKLVKFIHSSQVGAIKAVKSITSQCRVQLTPSHITLCPREKLGLLINHLSTGKWTAAAAHAQAYTSHEKGGSCELIITQPSNAHGKAAPSTLVGRTTTHYCYCCYLGGCTAGDHRHYACTQSTTNSSPRLCSFSIAYVSSSQHQASACLRASY